MKMFPSILSAEFSCLAPDIESVQEAGVNRLHLDIMDGHFVPNISFGFPVVRSIAERFPDMKLDAHLMITDPSKYLDVLLNIGVDWVSVHAEVEPPVEDIYRELRGTNTQLGVALNPDTGLSQLDGDWQYMDFLLLMTVQPGFGGQSFRGDVLTKIDNVPDTFDGPIQVDGGVGTETIGEAAAAGVDWFVSGSSVFGAENPGDACRGLLETAKQAQ